MDRQSGHLPRTEHLNTRAFRHAPPTKKAADFSAAFDGRRGMNYQFLVMRMPKRRGSVTKTLVVRPVSSVFRKAPVIAVVSNTFFI